MKRITDTNGLLDLCDCGARGAFVEVWGGWRVDCSECSQSTLKSRDKYKAMIEWNIMQREIKRELK